MKVEFENLFNLLEQIAPKYNKYLKLNIEVRKTFIIEHLKTLHSKKEKKKFLKSEIKHIDSVLKKNNIKTIIMTNSMPIKDLENFLIQVIDMKMIMPVEKKESLSNEDKELNVIFNKNTKLFMEQFLQGDFEYTESSKKSIELLCSIYDKIDELDDSLKSLMEEYCKGFQSNNQTEKFPINLEKFGSLLEYKYLNQEKEFLHQELNRLKSNSVTSDIFVEFPNVDIIFPNNWKNFKPKTPPEGFIPIKSSLTEEEILKFFSFLYLEKNGEDKPFITFEDYKQLLKYGLAVPNEINSPLISIDQSSQKPIGIIYYCIYKLYTANRYSSNAKIEYAKFLHYNFEDFSHKTVKYLVQNIRNKKPAKMKFNIEKYLP